MILHKILFIPDTHYPIQDENLVSKILEEVIPREKPSLIVHLGDLVDFKIISRFVNDPRKVVSLQDELELARNFFTRLRKKAPKARIIFKEGNHEERWLTYLKTRARELLGVSELSLNQLFKCKENKVEYYDAHTTLVLDGKLRITHGWYERTQAGYSAMGSLLDTDGVCGISGHTHKLAKVSRGDRWWIESGHIGQRNPDIWEYLKDKPANWQQGFSFGYQYDNGEYDINPIWVDSKGNFSLNGRRY